MHRRIVLKFGRDWCIVGLVINAENNVLNDCQNQTDPCSIAGTGVLRSKGDVKRRWRWRWRGLWNVAALIVKRQSDLEHRSIISGLISDSTGEVEVGVRTSTNVRHVCIQRTNQLRIRHSRICCWHYNNIHRRMTQLPVMSKRVEQKTEFLQ